MSDDFFSVLFEFLRMHRPSSILALVEIKVHSSAVQIILEKTQFNCIIVAEANGFSRDIWVLWNDTNLKFEILSVYDEIITLAIKMVIWSLRSFWLFMLHQR